MHSTKRAFTLVELLVVIAIIGVLMAILLPALGRAKAVAQRVNCGANMKQILTSAVVYAQQNKQNIPPTPAYSAQQTARPGTIDAIFMSSPMTTFLTGTTAQKLQTCPASNRGSSSYSWNPHPGFKSDQYLRIKTGPWGTGAQNYTDVRWNKLSSHPRTRLIIMDRADTTANIAHTGGKTNDASWNIGYTDGSVHLVTSKPLADRLKTTAGNIATPYSGTAFRQVNDYVRVLELTKSNRAIAIGPVGPLPAPAVGTGPTIPWNGEPNPDTNETTPGTCFYPYAMVAQPAAGE